MRAYRTLPTCLLTAFLTSALVLSGCDSDGDEDDVAGDYETVSFTAEIEGETVDLLDAGAFVEMTLREDGTASGRQFFPEEYAEGEENDTPFSGTYAVSSDEVMFDHEDDTFIRDAVWTYDDGTLRTETDVLTVVLRKE